MLFSLKGCKEQYNTMWNCIRTEVTRIEKREQELKNLVYGIEVEVPQKETVKEVEVKKEKTLTQYI